MATVRPIRARIIATLGGFVVGTTVLIGRLKAQGFDLAE